ncbi:MAG TPA: hypothetical protein VEC13_00595 [Candidatus Paceibacterota bacterium]|nr:hypothetical protein [Candidatus Paceibacterota bacterium]
MSRFLKILTTTLAISLIIYMIIRITTHDAVAPVEVPKEEVKMAVSYNKSTDSFDVSWSDGKSTSVKNVYEGIVINTSVVDINFDGRSDFEVSYGIGAYNGGTAYFAQNEDKTFAEYHVVPKPLDPELNYYPQLGFATFNPQNRTIETFYKGRGLGDIYYKALYKFEGNSWAISKTERQDFFGENTAEGPNYYINEVVEFKDNKSATTTTYLKVEAGDEEWNFVPVSKEEALKSLK